VTFVHRDTSLFFAVPFHVRIRSGEASIGLKATMDLD
jgi:hypothetical protein